MVNVVQSVGSGASSAALYVRASSAAAVLAADPVSAGAPEAVAAQPADQVVVPTSETYRYNSFEFSYRQDFGKIVLLRQRPDTGEVVQQFPSEYYLRKYADGERVVRAAVDTPQQQVASSAGEAVTEAPTSGETQLPAGLAPAPSLPSAPALPGGAGNSATVDLTV
jgi:hypothetical protein